MTMALFRGPISLFVRPQISSLVESAYTFENSQWSPTKIAVGGRAKHGMAAKGAGANHKMLVGSKYGIILKWWQLFPSWYSPGM